MSLLATVYLKDSAALAHFHSGIKLRACPHCHGTGFLIAHGALVGYGSARHDRIVRGQRFFCSNRFRQSGCGKTFSVLFDFLLKARSIPAALITSFLGKVLTGSSRKAAWQSISHPFSLESAYRIWNTWIAAQTHLRTWLFRHRPAPAQVGDSLTETWVHLTQIFADELCPIAAFQQHFQQPFFPH